MIPAIDKNNYYSVRQIQKLARQRFYNQLSDLPMYDNVDDPLSPYTLPDGGLHDGLELRNGEFLVQNQYIEELAAFDLDFADSVQTTCQYFLSEIWV